MPTLCIRGAREHNLRAIDLDLPLGTQISVVGPSGSGKTSLVHETLVREARRRYLGGLSPRARLLLGKLGRARLDGISGLPPTISIGSRTSRSDARSTVGTRTGLLDRFRLLFARTAMDPGGVELTRSHFSFNHPVGACPDCGGTGLEDRVDPALLVADPTRSIRGGALRPTLPSGYTVYSQVTVEVMDRVCRAHGFDVDTPWSALTDAQRDVVFHGTTALTVPFGKHSLESRMKWTGITARPREEGYYRGIVRVIEETLKRSRNDNILRYVRSVPCGACGGTRLARPGREARLGPWTLPGLLAVPVGGLGAALEAVPESPVWSAVRAEVQGIVERLVELELGHLSLDRGSVSLSGGEAQRLQLAAWVGARLGGQLIVLDEPTLGLHPESQPGLQRVLDALRELGNTVLVVEHDPDMVRRSDQLVVLGPGAGPEGGRVLYAGATDGGPGGADPLGSVPAPRPRRVGLGWMHLRGACLHNLAGDPLAVRLGTLNVVLGPSGAGKSSLVFGTLLPALRGEAGGGFDTLDGVPAGLRVLAVDASPIGRTPRSTPATWTGLFDLIRKRFAATPEARARGLRATAFSFNTKTGRCPTCEGLGVERVGLHLLEDIERPCPACRGGRYAPEVLSVRVRGRTIAEVLAMSAAEALAHFADDPALAALLQPMVDLGIGHLALGLSSRALSRGEAQRVKLAALLGRAPAGPSLLLMDEPDRGLHPDDVARLVVALDRMVDAGHTVLAISHHRHVWAAADHHAEVREGRVRRLDAPPREALSAVRAPRSPVGLPAAIALEGARQHNLQGVDVVFPHGRLTAVVGPSGSGKSSLVFDTLAAEAWARFSESLPFGVRRHIRRQARPALDAASGLTPVVALAQRAPRAGARSTVATQSGIGPLLRLLWSRAGRVDGLPADLLSVALSSDRVEGACPACQGGGTVPRCSPARLVTRPARSLRDGALGGTKPGRFLGEPDGQYLATLGAVLGEEALDRPWSTLTAGEREVALHGAGEQVVSVRWAFSRGRRSGEHTFEGRWVGLCALVEQEARVRARRKDGPAWAALLVDTPCTACGGERLNAAARTVELGGLRLPEAMALPLGSLVSRVASLQLSADQEKVLAATWPEIRARVSALEDLELGHLSLARRTASLSDGELQRVRLAAVSDAGLTGLTVVLDEPCAGLGPEAVPGLVRRLRALCAAGNTVVTVAHREGLIRAADHVVELGPGAGPAGGRVVAAGPADAVLRGEGATARALGAAAAVPIAAAGGDGVRVRGADRHNLADLDLELPRAGFVAVTGPSGSGKSSLLGVLAASAEAGAATGCQSVEGLERYATVRGVDRHGSTPLDSLGLLPSLQGAFHAAGTEPGLSRAAFSFRSAAGRCPTCRGTGVETVSMDALADLRLPCPACRGARYRPELLRARWAGLGLVEVLDLPSSVLRERLPVGRLHDGVDAMCEVGLGHVPLGREVSTLSGGERQRLSLAGRLVVMEGPVLHLLDEPGRGLHPGELGGLVELIRGLVSRGDLVVAAVHRTGLAAAASLELRLGPGAGPDGGRIVYCGRPGPSGS